MAEKHKLKRIKRNIDLLRGLHTATPSRQNRLIQHADKEFTLALCDCAKNILNKNIPTTSEENSKLRPYRKTLRYLAKKGPKYTEKKRTL